MARTRCPRSCADSPAMAALDCPMPCTQASLAAPDGVVQKRRVTSRLFRAKRHDRTLNQHREEERWTAGSRRGWRRHRGDGLRGGWHVPADEGADAALDNLGDAHGEREQRVAGGGGLLLRAAGRRGVVKLEDVRGEVVLRGVLEQRLPCAMP
jgi:hypothetical protein